MTPEHGNNDLFSGEARLGELLSLVADPIGATAEEREELARHCREEAAQTLVDSGAAADLVHGHFMFDAMERAYLTGQDNG